MNNKGFAITGMLYGVLLLFLMVLLSLLYVLVTRINRLTTLNEEVKKVVEDKTITAIATEFTDGYYITTMRGKYVININGNTDDCYAYLPKDILLKINNSKLSYLLPDTEGELNVFDTEHLQELSLIGCTNDGITNFSIKSIYS